MLQANQLPYQTHIDGLRAVAVLSVLFYHVGFSLTPGGFVGVDVFFVISGYLITTIVRAEIASGTFSFARFYERRIRRLLPAFVPVALVTSVAAYCLFLDPDFIDYAKSLGASFLFSSNWYFMATSGYFDAPADTKLLLHTWSLSVEEQYYFFFPIVLLLTHRLAPTRTAAVISVIFALSLGLSVFLMQAGETTEAFFNSFGRFWEMMVGSALSYVRSDSLSNRQVSAFRAAGLAMIAYACFKYTENTPFPGLTALLPTLGAALVIVGGPSRPGSITAALSAIPLVYTGKISYSLYLWHWPVIVLATYYNEQLSPQARVLCCVASFALAAASYHFVELPFRRSSPASRRAPVFAAFAGVSSIALAFSAAVPLTNAMPWRFSAHLRSDFAKANEYFSSDCKQTPLGFENLAGCWISASDSYDISKINYVVWGDSLAITVGGVFENYAARHNVNFVILSTAGCSSIIEIVRQRDKDRTCPAINRRIVDFVSKTRANVILVSSWNSLQASSKGPFSVISPEGMPYTKSELIATLREKVKKTVELLPDRQIWVLGQPPRYPEEIDTAVARSVLLGRPPKQYISREAFLAEEAKTRSIFSGISTNLTFLSVADAFCPDTFCTYAKGSLALYHDMVHVNRSGALLLESVLFEALDRLKS